MPVSLPFSPRRLPRAHRRTPALRVTAGALLAVLFSTLLGALPAAPARAAGESPDPALVEAVKKAVMAELRKEGFLQSEIEARLERFVRKQRERAAADRARQQRAAGELASRARPVDESDHVYGNPDAEVTIIEYSDFECPFCKRFHGTVKQVVDASGGRVNWVYRHFPLSFHKPLAQKQAEATECAAELGGNDAFWRLSDAIFERTRSNGQGMPAEELVPMAGRIGLDEERFRACLQSGKWARHVDQDFEDGVRAGITGTPGNIVRNNRTGTVRARGGAMRPQTLQSLIEAVRSGS